jgi:hypothetical protein
MATKISCNSGCSDGNLSLFHCAFNGVVFGVVD